MEPAYLQRAKAFKSEMFDSAGAEEKLLQKENEFMDLKKNMKLKVRVSHENALWRGQGA